MRCVLVGNYGVGNVGDEALCEYFLSEFPEANWIVVSGQKPEAGNKHGIVPRLPFGVRSFFAPWWKTLSAIRTSDLVVFGGGSLFTDTESVKACMIWWMYAAAARLFGRPYALAFQGVGPFRTHLGRAIASWVYRRATFVSVRDSLSLARAKKLGCSVDPVLSFDPAYAHFAKAGESQGEGLIVIPRTNSTEEFFASVTRHLKSYSGPVTVLLLEPERETAVADRLRSLVPSCKVIPIQTVASLLEEISKGSFAIVQRYHGALAALARGVRVEIIPQRAGDKMDALRETVESGEFSTCLTFIETGAKKLRELLH